MIRFNLIMCFMILVRGLFCQNFVNGNFENTTATGDQINLSNTALNEMLPGVTSFGSYGDVDIIRSADYGGSGAQSQQWYLGITGGGTDIIAITLTKPLVEGKRYTISFYDRKHSGYPAHPIQIGLSENNSSFGTAVYTGKDAPVLNVWTKRTFTFTAKENSNFITVQMPVGGLYDWANIDNFVFENMSCNEELVISASANTIKKGDQVTLTASGASSYSWSASTLTNDLNSARLNDQPQFTTLYTVKSKQEGCPVLTATVLVDVIQPEKDSVIINKKVKDSAEVKQHIVKYNRHRLKGRKLDIQEAIDVNDAEVKLMVWDKNRIDGDIVSIYLNGQLLEENLEVTKEKKEIVIHLQAGSNLVVMHAINLGRIPPNTAALSVNNNKHKLITLVSDLRKSGALEIIYNPDAISNR